MMINLFLLYLYYKLQHSLTFNADDMLANLLGQMGIRHELYEVVDGIDGGVDGLEPLDLLADGQGVGHVGDVAAPVGPHPHYM